MTRLALCGVIAAALLQPHPAVAAYDWPAFEMAGERIEPGTRHKFTILGERSFEGSFVDFAVYVARGTAP